MKTINSRPYRNHQRHGLHDRRRHNHSRQGTKRWGQRPQPTNNNVFYPIATIGSLFCTGNRAITITLTVPPLIGRRRNVTPLSDRLITTTGIPCHQATMTIRLSIREHVQHRAKVVPPPRSRAIGENSKRLFGKRNDRHVTVLFCRHVRIPQYKNSQILPFRPLKRVGRGRVATGNRRHRRRRRAGRCARNWREGHFLSIVFWCAQPAKQ